MQGFDEFMNLVIDDAIEVKQPTKLDPEETRRSLGMFDTVCFGESVIMLISTRPDLAQGRQRLAHPELVMNLTNHFQRL